MTPSRTCFSENGLIMSCSWDILRIQRSLFSMELPFKNFKLGNFVIEQLNAEQLNMDASHTRDYCVAQNGTHRAARPDPSSAKCARVRMTTPIHCSNRTWLGACRFTG